METSTARLEDVEKGGLGSSSNVASFLTVMAKSAPDRVAVVVCGDGDNKGRTVRNIMSFAELEAHSNRYANGLASTGIRRGMRALVMVHPGFEFLGVIFALFRMGVVPVLIDPGMGIRRLLDCIQDVDIQALIGVPKAHLLRVMRFSAFRALRYKVVVGRKRVLGSPTLDELARNAGDSYKVADTAGDDPAAVLFTSGSTGPAKGVVYEHGMFLAQVRMLQAAYGIEPGEVDLPCFPLFALFGPALGMSCVFPEMDPSHPARVDPVKIVDAIRTHEVTNTFGSPAMWRRVAAYCVKESVKLPSLRRILIAGAPVPPSVIEQLHQVIDARADVHTPYGATEALPVSSISGREILRDCRAGTREGAGTCVGRPMPGIDLRIIRIRDEPIDEWSDDLSVPDGELGEVVVAGAVVTRAYFGLPQADRLAKMSDGSRTWHRMGDVGYRDQAGRIWFCGRKAHRVETANGVLMTVPCEAVFNEHPDVYRSALVGVGPRGGQEPVIIVEPEPGRFPSRARAGSLRDELLELGHANERTRTIKTILFHRSLPVDIRHNAKIDREALSRWSAKKVR